jgi:sRNA-binding regulator protein Hfq
MVSPNTRNPYWEKALQYQQQGQQGGGQRNQGRQQQQRQQPQGKVQVQEDFSGDWRRRRVITKVAEGTNVNTIEGVVEDVSRYWIKLRVDGEILYVNKAHIISIRVAEVKDPVGGSNAGK